MDETKISLTLEEEPLNEEIEKVDLEPKKELDFSEQKLSDEEKQMVDEFSKKIDLSETATIIQYGSTSQHKIADFSANALKNVKTKDLDTVGDALTNLVGELKNFDVDEKDSGIVGWFKKTFNKVSNIKTRYDSVENNVQKIEKILEDHQITLLKDISLLDQLYEKNQINYKELCMYILAGKKALENYRNVDLANAKEIALKTKNPEDVQKVNDIENAITRFEKKLHDLDITRVVALQMAPQIRLIQNNDVVLTEKIQTALVNTIPIWKSQMLIALGLSHSKEALKVSREVSDLTNKMLVENSKTLKEETIAIAKENERSIIDIETLKKTNENLINTLDEVSKIQEEGRNKRKAAEAELRQIETQINDRLLMIKKDIKQ